MSASQGNLFNRKQKPKKRAPNTTEDGELACSFGEPWLGPHPLCRAHTAQTCGVPIEDVLLPDFSHLKETKNGSACSTDEAE